MIYDITPLISPRLAVFPGDTPPSRHVVLEIARGDNITLSTLTTTVHAGAHADAPSHYGADGPTIDRWPIEPYLGPAAMIRLACEPGARFAWSEVERGLGRIGVERPERLLIATGTFPDPERWAADFSAPDAEVISQLAERGTRLIGVDTPSVDLSSSKLLPTHKMVLHHGMAILEGIVLHSVPEGVYELIALPLKIEGFDGSPVRAILRAAP